MRTWAILLGGLLVWAAHFFLLYGVIEFTGGTVARLSVAAFTLVCLIADAVLARALLRSPVADAFALWRTRLAVAGVGLSALAVFWQALPALVTL